MNIGTKFCCKNYLTEVHSKCLLISDELTDNLLFILLYFGDVAIIGLTATKNCGILSIDHRQ